MIYIRASYYVTVDHLGIRINHSSFKHFILQFIVSQPSSNMCSDNLFTRTRRHLPLPVFLSIPFNCHALPSNHAIPLSFFHQTTYRYPQGWSFLEVMFISFTLEFALKYFIFQCHYIYHYLCHFSQFTLFFRSPHKYQSNITPFLQLHRPASHVQI